MAALRGGAMTAETDVAGFGATNSHLGDTVSGVGNTVNGVLGGH